MSKISLAFLGAELGDQLQVVGGEELHRVEEDGFEAKDGEDGVGSVEIYVGEYVRHNIVDDVLQPWDPIHQQGHALGGDS